MAQIRAAPRGSCEAARALRPQHPFNRIIAIKEAAGKIIVTTTDLHLPRRIGEALQAAFDGTLHFDYESDGYFVRVTWTRT